ncbi:MAG TPA: hypothetical protein VGH48_17800 [Caldimonas sp.]
MLVLGVATWVPWLGAIVALPVLLLGTGALLMALRHVLPVAPAAT